MDSPVTYYCNYCENRGNNECGTCEAKNEGLFRVPTNFVAGVFNPARRSTTSELDRHAAICSELTELYRRKNADYGDSFHKTFLEEGVAMSRIRLSDKLERFKRLTKSGEQNVKDESVRDTLIDLANYAIMTILELEEKEKTHD